MSSSHDVGKVSERSGSQSTPEKETQSTTQGDKLGDLKADDDQYQLNDLKRKIMEEVEIKHAQEVKDLMNEIMMLKTDVSAQRMAVAIYKEQSEQFLQLHLTTIKQIMHKYTRQLELSGVSKETTQEAWDKTIREDPAMAGMSRTAQLNEEARRPDITSLRSTIDNMSSWRLRFLRLAQCASTGMVLAGFEHGHVTYEPYEDVQRSVTVVAGQGNRDYDEATLATLHHGLNSTPFSLTDYFSVREEPVEEMIEPRPLCSPIPLSWGISPGTPFALKLLADCQSSATVVAGADQGARNPATKDVEYSCATTEDKADEEGEKVEEDGEGREDREDEEYGENVEDNEGQGQMSMSSCAVPTKIVPTCVETTDGKSEDVTINGTLGSAPTTCESPMRSELKSAASEVAAEPECKTDGTLESAPTTCESPMRSELKSAASEVAAEPECKTDGTLESAPTTCELPMKSELKSAASEVAAEPECKTDGTLESSPTVKDVSMENDRKRPGTDMAAASNDRSDGMSHSQQNDDVEAPRKKQKFDSDSGSGGRSEKVEGETTQLEGCATTEDKADEEGEKVEEDGEHGEGREDREDGEYGEYGEDSEGQGHASDEERTWLIRTIRQHPKIWLDGVVLDMRNREYEKVAMLMNSAEGSVKRDRTGYNIYVLWKSIRRCTSPATKVGNPLARKKFGEEIKWLHHYQAEGKKIRREAKEDPNKNKKLAIKKKKDLLQKRREGALGGNTID